MPHIAVLDPGTKFPELANYNRIALTSSLPTTYHLPAQQGVDSIRRIEDDIVGVIIFGSGASVHDDDPWQTELNQWLEPRLATLPMLGLCYGHQLLAHLLGGKVEYLTEDRTKLRGVRDVPLLADPLWGDAVTGPMVVSHSEHVSKLPPHTINRGSSAATSCEAFCHESLPLWGVQAHPEATTAFTTNNGIPFDADPSLLAHGHSVVDAFTKWVADRS